METSQGAVSEFVRPQLEQLVALFASRAARCGAATLVQIWMPQTDVSGWQFLATSNCPYALIGTGDSFSILRSVSAAQCLGIALPPSGASTIVKTFVHERAFYHEDITLVPSFARCPTTEEAVRFGARTALVLPIWRGIPGQYNDPAPIAILEALITAPNVPVACLIGIASVSASLAGVRIPTLPPAQWSPYLPVVSDAKAVITAIPAKIKEEVVASISSGQVEKDALPSRPASRRQTPSLLGPARLLQAEMSKHLNVALEKNDVDPSPNQEECDLEEKESDEDEEAGLSGRSSPAAYFGLTLEDLQSQFGVGLREAAQNLGISITTLKRCCRKNGIRRWPRRELVKLQKAIDSVGLVGGCALAHRVLGPAVAPAAVAPSQPKERTLDADPGEKPEGRLDRMEQDAMQILFSLNTAVTHP